MILREVMGEAKEVLDDVDGLRKVFPHPVPRASATGGTAIVSYPEQVEFGVTYGRRYDRFVGLGIVIVVGTVTERTALDRVSALIDPAGTTSTSAVAALEAHTWQSCDDFTVSDCDFDVITVAGIDYLAAILSANVIGPGRQ